MLTALRWCTECSDIVPYAVDINGPVGCNKSHPKKIVEIREDILKDAIRRLVHDLKRTNRV